MTHRLTMNHAIWLTDDDIAIMGEAGCSITHNPLANLKLGSGVSPIRRLKNAGVNVAPRLRQRRLSRYRGHLPRHQVRRHAGTRSAASTYTEWVGAHEAYEMATHGGARSAMIEDRVGSLEVGKQADIIPLDRYDWGFPAAARSGAADRFSASVQNAVQTSFIRGRRVTQDQQTCPGRRG